MWSIKIFFILLSARSILSVELLCARHPELEVIHCKLSEKTDGLVTITSYVSLEGQNFDNETELEISYSNLGRHLSHGIGHVFKNLKGFDVSYSSVAIVDRTCFENMKNLKDLRLFFNDIEELPSDVFSDLQQLTIISLAKNKIKKLPNNLFDHNRELKILRLNDNLIEVIEREIFKYNLELKELSLQKNAIKRINFDFSTHKSIVLLDLSGNKGSCNMKFDKKLLDMNEVQKEIAVACNQ
ncbi:hypothetical protein PVAND_015962 [Polypedilum vanderplanki]|uniref:Uncharacterized protein n=1 Tax=Polypedilum vanderplanki TaxID=319348 RepID=A0A9J6BE38_POLVA|nr:hypothetical protein PVAND_015962 [Polypedilum vanderplanki]